jgi:tetratricopeptide (TPR) repeat protein
VLARPVGRLERGWRWCRRNPAVAGLTTTVAGLLLATAVGASLMSYRNGRLALENAGLAESRREALENELHLRQEAQAEAKKAEQMAQFLIGTFQAADPLGLDAVGFTIPRATGERLTAEEVLDRGAAKVRELGGSPVVQARVLDAIGNVYRSRGDKGRAEPLLLEALDLRRKTFGEDHIDVAASHHNLGRLWHENGDYVGARAAYERALAVQRRLAPDGPEVTQSLQDLAWLLGEMEEGAETERLFREALDRRRAAGDRRGEAVTKIALAALYIDADRLAEAVPLAKEGADLFLGLEGNKSLAGAVARFQDGEFAWRVFGDRRRAERLLRESLEQAREALGTRHQYTALPLHELAALLVEDKRDAEAEDTFRACVRVVRESVGLHHPKLDIVVSNFAVLLRRRGKVAEADALFAELLAAKETKYGRDHPFVADALVRQARFLTDSGRGHGEALLARALAIYRKAPFRNPVQFPVCLNDLGMAIRAQQGRAAEAEGLMREAIALAEKLPAGKLSKGAQARVNLAETLLQQGKLDGVEAELSKALESCGQAGGGLTDLIPGLHDLMGANSRRIASHAYRVFVAYHRQSGRPAEALAAGCRARTLAKGEPGLLYDAACELALCAAAAGPKPADGAAGEQAALEALAVLREATDAGFRNTALLESDKDLAAVRGRPEFAGVLRRVKEKTKAGPRGGGH